MVNLYGFIIGVAALSALQASVKYAEKVGVKKEVVEKAFWWVMVGGIIGARAYHVVHLWGEVYSLDPVSALFVWNGGLGIWGAIVGGLAGLIANFKFQISNFKNKVELLSLMNVAVIGVPLGQAIGRLGNFVNGELYGKNGEPLWAIEAGLNLLLFVVLWRMGGVRCRPLKVRNPLSLKLQSAEGYEPPFASGKITAGYLIGYGLIRMLLENLRPDDVVWKWHKVPVAMIFGMISVFAGGVIWKGKRS